MIFKQERIIKHTSIATTYVDMILTNDGFISNSTTRYPTPSPPETDVAKDGPYPYYYTNIYNTPLIRIINPNKANQR